LVDIPAISTGSLGLDIALGRRLPAGGCRDLWPRVVGQDDVDASCDCGSSASGTAAFIDAEHALDLTYAKLGVQVDDLLVSQPDTGEQALEIAETLVRSGAIDVIVVDSVAALVPRAEIEGEMGCAYGAASEAHVAALRKLTAAISSPRRP
jgi:recombination protein RecA